MLEECYMHMLIKILVFAKDAEGALEVAHEVVHEKLKTTDDGGPFDYYVDFTDSPRKDPGMINEEAFIALMNNNGHPIQGGFAKNRWGSISPVLQVSTARFPTDDKRGMEMANSAMENNRLAFKSSMERIRSCIANYNDDQLFDEVEDKGEIEEKKTEDDLVWFRIDCGVVSGVQGPECFLYDFWGDPISSLKRLQLILDDSDSDPYYIDETNGKDPNWGRHIWNQPLWVVPFDVHF
jgi:hypothetical protein